MKKLKIRDYPDKGPYQEESKAFGDWKERVETGYTKIARMGKPSNTFASPPARPARGLQARANTPNRMSHQHSTFITFSSSPYARMSKTVSL